eukprot:Filipodium_phascolosomae@DN6777_c0_g1_i1.p1
MIHLHAFQGDFPWIIQVITDNSLFLRQNLLAAALRRSPSTDANSTTSTNSDNEGSNSSTRAGSSSRTSSALSREASETRKSDLTFNALLGADATYLLPLVDGMNDSIAELESGQSKYRGFTKDAKADTVLSVEDIIERYIDQVHELVVPTTYQTANGSLFKARALHWAIEY